MGRSRGGGFPSIREPGLELGSSNSTEIGTLAFPQTRFLFFFVFRNKRASRLGDR